MWSMTKLPKAPKGNRIAFFGPMASGKTYCATYLEENYGYERLALADKLKAIAYELYGVAGKDGDNRRIIQELGDALRSFDNDVFTKYTLEKVNYLSSLRPNLKIVIDDLRLPREAELLKENGFELIQIITSEEARAERIARLYPSLPAAPQGHVTETSWASILPDAGVFSDTVADLSSLDSLMEKYLAD